MKKIYALVLIMALMTAMLAGCGKTTPASSDASGIVKLGLGQLTSIAKSKDLGVDAEGKEVLPLGQVDTVMVAAGFDKDGKVVSVTIDTAQTKVKFDNLLQVTSDVAAENKTKVELGDGYGMIKASTIGKEWYQQAAELEKWMVGKTIAEIKAMKMTDGVPAEADLTSLVSVSVGDYIAALEEAFTKAVDVKGAVKVGLGHNIAMNKSKSLGKDAEGKEVLPVAQVDTVMAATAFDKDGKVVATIIDNAQTKVTFDAMGLVTADKTAENKTKVELGDAYGMVKASTIGKEWYQQAAALGKWMVGKSVADIKAMKVTEKDASHPAVPAESDLTALVTVSVEHYIAAVEEGFAKAK